MSTERVHPNVVLKLWVSDGDMSCHSFGETATREVSKDGRHVDEDVTTVGSMIGKDWNTWECC